MQKFKNVIMNNLSKVLILSTIITFFSCSKSSDSDVTNTPAIVGNDGTIGFENTTPVSIADGVYNQSTNIDTPSETISTINVARTGTISDKNKFVLEMNIAHPRQNQISVKLIAPDNTEYFFIERAGFVAKYIGANKLRFSAAFTNSLPGDNVDFPAGNYKESNVSGVVTNPLPPIFSTIQGKNIQGIWKLKIIDAEGGSTGSLLSWKLIFG